ncbi:MAG: hypothetical protein V7740_01810 [Pseudomonas marincola]
MCASPAQVQADPVNWLPPDSRIDVQIPPDEFLSITRPLKGHALLGKLLFNSPSLLGETAVRIGLTCNSCHPNGHVNTGFFMPGLSSLPGTIDITHNFWGSGTEDGVLNPITIPSLRGVSKSAPYGTLTVLPTLGAFTRHVIETEFAGPSVQPYELTALIAYMSLLETMPKGDKQTYVQASLSAYFALLIEPLEKKQIEDVVRITHLIREELGRRIKVSPELRAEYEGLSQTLIFIQRTARTHPANARDALNKHLGSAD